MSTSFITPGHVRAFQAVTTQLYGEVTLASCLINGKPSLAIVLMEHVGDGKIGVMPLFACLRRSGFAQAGRHHARDGHRFRRRSQWRERRGRRAEPPRVQ
jgi:hypothetical protein